MQIKGRMYHGTLPLPLDIEVTIAFFFFTKYPFLTFCLSGGSWSCTCLLWWGPPPPWPPGRTRRTQTETQTLFNISYSFHLFRTELWFWFISICTRFILPRDSELNDLAQETWKLTWQISLNRSWNSLLCTWRTARAWRGRRSGAGCCCSPKARRSLCCTGRTWTRKWL